jgi:hypothetical protein
MEFSILFEYFCVFLVSSVGSVFIIEFLSECGPGLKRLYWERKKK